MPFTNVCEKTKEALIFTFKKATGMARMEANLTDKELRAEALDGTGSYDNGTPAGIFYATTMPIIASIITPMLNIAITGNHAPSRAFSIWAAAAITLPITCGQIYSTYKCLQQKTLDRSNVISVPKL